MPRIAVFTEGLTEQILVRESLRRLVDPSKLSFDSYQLLAHDLRSVPYSYPNPPNPKAEFFFLIIDAHGDEGVLSAIKERERDLIEKGRYDAILGLRDMYSDAYDKLAKGAISPKVSARLTQTHAAVIQSMTYHKRIKLHYAIMETEAWILAMHRLFRKLDPVLTPDFVVRKLGFNLTTVDPQVAFYRPSIRLNEVLSLVGRGYKKNRSDIESICSKIERSDLDDITSNGRCASFQAFRTDLLAH